MRVAAIVLNWRGWADTVECLESLLRTDPAPAMVIVCDNASGDGSVDRIRDWAAGRLEAPLPGDPALRHLTTPPLPKPIPLLEGPRIADARVFDAAPGGGTPLVMIETGGNLGYAGGNNVGIRFALGQPEIDAVWILNNDTVVSPGALGELIRETEATGAGICGSTLLYYDRPSVVQTLGGASYNARIGLPKHIGEGEPLVRAPTPDEVRARLDFVNGASMLVTRALIEDVGLMDESYFLYFEELDWALRAGGRYTLGYAQASVVFHKEGRSIDTRGSDRKSELSDRYFHRNRLEITRRYFPASLWTVRLALLATAARRAARGQWGRVRLILDLARRG